MDEIQEILKQSGRLKDQFMSILCNVLPQMYYAESIEDFLLSKEKLRGGNVFQSLAEPEFFKKAIVILSQTRYLGIEKNLVNIEDFSGKLSLPFFNKPFFLENNNERGINNRQNVHTVLIYEPKKDNLWIYMLYSTNIPRKQEKMEKGLNSLFLNFAENPV